MKLLVVGLLVSVASQAAAKAPTPRTLSPDVTKLACPGAGVDARAARAAAWAAGLYDAQVEGRYLEKLGSRAVGKVDAERKAKALAHVKRYGSYAFGLCDGGDAWAMAFPAPSPLVKAPKQDRWTLPVAALAESCSSFRVDAAGRDAGAPMQLAVVGDKIETGKIESGTLSVTCQPKAPRWQGPVVWFLAPIGAGPGAVPPEADALVAGADVAQTLAAWTNRVRTKAGLSPLDLASALTEQATTLAVDGSLTHDRQMLAKASARLKDTEVSFLGEDRVRGTDAQDMAWLLWNSPRHRGLLLNKDATTIGIGLRGIGSEQLAVLVVGKKAPLTTAAGGQPPSRKTR